MRDGHHPMTALLVEALEELQDEWRQREVPTPSVSGTECLRQLWFAGRHYPRTNRVTAAGILAMEQGKAQEPLVYDLYRRLGYEVIEQVTVPADRIACAEDGTADAVLQTPDGERVLLEIKRLGWFQLSLLVRDGLAAAHPRYYAQVQLYMHGLEIRRCYFTALSADYSALSRLWSSRQWGELPPPIWVEEVPYDAREAARLLERNRFIRRLIEKADSPRQVPRYTDPATNDRYPCGYCGWREACLQAGE